MQIVLSKTFYFWAWTSLYFHTIFHLLPPYQISFLLISPLQTYFICCLHLDFISLTAYITIFISFEASIIYFFPPVAEFDCWFIPFETGRKRMYLTHFISYYASITAHILFADFICMVIFIQWSSYIAIFIKFDAFI